MGQSFWGNMQILCKLFADFLQRMFLLLTFFQMKGEFSNV